MKAKRTVQKAHGTLYQVLNKFGRVIWESYVPTVGTRYTRARAEREQQKQFDKLKEQDDDTTSYIANVQRRPPQKRNEGTGGTPG